MSLDVYIAAQAAKFEALIAQRRNDKHRMSWLQPGPRKLVVYSRRYSGAELRSIRATHGVGRPPLHNLLGGKVKSVVDTLPFPLATRIVNAIAEHGSQRKAAAALGITLGKLQRELRKATV